MSRRALVLGGTGVVGRAVVAQLAGRGVRCAFTYNSSRDVADALVAAHDVTAHHIDLRDPDAVRALFDTIEPPDVLIHCAAAGEPAALGDITDDAWLDTQRVNCQSALIATQQLARRAGDAGADVVFVGALDRTQSMKIPVAFAATQGMLSAMAMALGKELGARGIRVNMIALGLLGEGISERLIPALRADFEAYSALRRVATADEAARAIAWLALDNEYMTAKVIPVNGGI